MVAELPERQPEKNGQQQHLQDLSLSEGTDEGAGDQVEQEIDRAHLPRSGGVAGEALGIQRGGVGVETRPRREDIRDDQADHEGDGRDHLEIKEGLEADAADLLEVPHPREPDDHRRKDDRGDEHLDQIDEPVAQRPERDAPLRLQVAEQPAKDDADENLDVEVDAPAGGGFRRGGGGWGNGHPSSL